MTKFSYCIQFDLEVVEDIPIMTCTCRKTFNIEVILFGKTKNLLHCPFCNKLWHFERNRESETMLLIALDTSGGISLKKINNEWTINKN